MRGYNRKAWDKNVEDGNEWTRPVDEKTIQAARAGDWRIYLTPLRPVPLDWFPPSKDLPVLCLASGGGQQAPVLAAAGARVTVLDNSPRQLAQDRFVAQRDNLDLLTVEGDMADLSMFPDGSFDLIVHPVSNVFVPHVLPVWYEAHRVLRLGGSLLAGFMNPAFFLFDRELMDDQAILQVRYSIPYSDLESASPQIVQRQLEAGWPIEFGHTLEDQIGGQLAAGFVLTGFYEDRDPNAILDDFMPVYIVTRAVKTSDHPLP